MTRVSGRHRQIASFFRNSARRDEQRSYDFRALFSTVLRYRVGLLVWVLAGLALAGTYIVFTPPEYTAYTQIVLETPKRPRLVLDADGDPAPMDSAQADSRIQVIKSERLLRSVFDTLGLADKLKIEAASKNGVLSFIFGKGKRSDDASDTSAFLDFMDHVSARRIGLSYVLELSYRAKSPSDAAQTVNSITSAYIRDLVMSAPSDSEVMQRRIFSVSHDAELLLAAIKSGTIPKMPIMGIDARVIGAAIEPLRKSSPHTLLAMAFALLAALTTGGAFILFVHNRDRKFRTFAQATRSFGSDLLGVIPAVTGIEASAGDIADAILALPLQGEHPKVGIVSWQNPAATSDVAKCLAERLCGDAYSLALVASPQSPQSPGAKELPAAPDIFVDVPPLSTSAALVSIGKALSGVIVVVEKDATAHDDVSFVLDLLDGSSTKFLGFVFYVPESQPTFQRRLFDGLKKYGKDVLSSRRTVILPRLKLRVGRSVNLPQMKLGD